MSTAYVYTARFAPLHRDISVPHERTGPVVLDETTFAAWMHEPWDVNVCVDHDPNLKIGRCSDIRVKDGWYEADFILHQSISDLELEVGQPVSLGARKMNTANGVVLLSEISITR